jgi:MerR family transcriptional regulator, light-induced transcriptional regulator
MLAAPTLREGFLAALLAADATRARHLIDRAVAGGMPIADVYLEVLAPAMREVGELWEAAQVSVAYEHYATSITQGILGALGPRMRVPPTTGRLAVVACTPGERHALGAQMVSDFLEGAGWEVLNVGPSLPTADLVGLVEDEQPDVVGLSTATVDRLAGAEAAIAALRELDPAPYVVVGGLAWRSLQTEEARTLGADAYVEDAAALTALLTERFPTVDDD